MKQQFTDNERLQLIGLLTLARSQGEKLSQTTHAIGEMIGDEDRASDAVYGRNTNPVEEADYLIRIVAKNAEREAAK